MQYYKHGGDIYSYFEKFGRQPIDFSSNLNLLGMPKNLLENFDNMHKEFSVYPDTKCTKLVSKIALYEDVDTSQILCGNGASELIFAISNALIPKKVLIPAPTFSEYELSIKDPNCAIDYIYLSEQNDFKLDINLVKKYYNGHDLMFLCSPNNPTGRAESKECILEILDFLNENNCLLVLDHCFISFLTDEDDFSLVSELKKYKNLIILKAFTKIFSLAGIRLGYMLTSNLNILAKVSSVIPTWSVSSVAQICGQRALSDLDFLKESKICNDTESKFLVEHLNKFPLKVYTPQANYIFFKCSDINLKFKLEERGILIRSCENYIGLDNTYYRIAVKSRDLNKIFLKNLEEIFYG